MAKVDEVVTELAEWLVGSIEQGTDGTWKAPWHDLAGWADLMSPTNALTEKDYRGINTLILATTAHDHGWSSGTWATYKQWQELGAQVNKGEHGTSCVKWVSRKQADEAATAVKDTMFPVAFTLFNADQVDGYEPVALPEREWTPVEEAERFFAQIGADVRHQNGNVACYRPALDYIVMPLPEQFADMERYYGVLAHEHTHWTGHKDRNARDFSGRFGDDAYALEELVAELGSATVLARLGLSAVPQPDHARYIEHWVRVLQTTPKALMTVCAKASDAVEYLEVAAQPALDAAVVLSEGRVIEPDHASSRSATEMAL